VARLDVALSPDVDGAGLAARGESTRAACLAGQLAEDDNARAFIVGAPLRYLASRDQSEVARDASLVAQLTRSPAATEALLAVSPGPAEGAYAVTIASENRPELLARLSGAMALAGLDILSVEAHGVTAGITLDTFVVTSATARPVSTETFATLERLVRAALRDRLELAVRLRERRKHYPARVSGAVTVSVEPVGWMTELRVAAPDRPGLLHDIARAVSATGLGIGWAKVRTIDGVAHDVFSLVGPEGGPADDPGLLGHVTMRIREAL
jgi:[protein-PII] uridylyltransferase